MTAPLLSDLVDKTSLQAADAELREIHVTLRLVVVLLAVNACLLAAIAYLLWQWRPA